MTDHILDIAGAQDATSCVLYHQYFDSAKGLASLVEMFKGYKFRMTLY